MKRLVLTLFFFIITTLSAQQWQIIDTTGFTWYSNADNFTVVSAGELWLGNNEASSALTYYSDGMITTYDSASYATLPGDITRNLTIDNSGNIWFTASSFNTDGGIVRYDGTSFTLFDTSVTHQRQYFVADISVDSHNNVWFTDNTRITKFDGSTWVTVDYLDLLNLNLGFGAIEFDDDDNKWIETEEGIVVLYNDGSFTMYDTTNTQLKSQNISDIEFDSEGNIWIATYWGGVAKANSDFSSVTVWDTTNSQISAGGDYNTARSVEIDNNGTVWVGHETGVASYDGSTWTYYNSSNSPLPEYDGTTQLVYDIQVDENNNKYFLTLFGGVYIYNESVINDRESEDAIPNKFKLSQNYPNPFNPSTTISYSIPEASKVSLKVYDILGKEVAELINTEKPAGTYDVNFDAYNLSSGVYFYTIKAGKFIQTKKMVLMR